MFPLHQCFLTANSIYLLVFDLTKWEDQLPSMDEWVQQIVVSGSNGTKTPIVFVGTHQDCMQNKLVEEELLLLQKTILQRYPLNRYRGIVQQTFSVSCRTWEGMPELREKLTHLASIIQPVGSAQWMRVNEHLQWKCREKNKKLLGLDEFIKVAEVHGVTDKRERAKMTNFLRDIGTLNYFPDHDSDLKETVILDSAWLSTEIHLWMTRGAFSPKQDAALMEKVLIISQQLGLVHLLPDGSSVIPNNLPPSLRTSHLWQTPAIEEATFEHSRVYRFGFLPDGLFSRIISRILSMNEVEPLNIWRYGVAIRREGQIAVVTHTPVVAGHIVHEVQVHCVLPTSLLYRGSAQKQLIINPHKLLLYDLVILVQNMVLCYFPHLFDSTSQWIPCYHCLQEKSTAPHHFHLSQLLRAHRKHENFIHCPYPHQSSEKPELDWQRDWTLPLWLPLLIPDHMAFFIDSVWDDNKAWLEGKNKTLSLPLSLSIESGESHSHSFDSFFIPSSSYKEENDFFTLRGQSKDRKSVV